MRSRSAAGLHWNQRLGRQPSLIFPPYYLLLEVHHLFGGHRPAFRRFLRACDARGSRLSNTGDGPTLVRLHRSLNCRSLEQVRRQHGLDNATEPARHHRRLTGDGREPSSRQRCQGASCRPVQGEIDTADTGRARQPMRQDPILLAWSREGPLGWDAREGAMSS